MIEIPAKVGGSDVTFQFKRMQLEDSTEWASKLRSRVLAKEGATKEWELLAKTPVGNRDMDKYLRLGDLVARMNKDIILLVKSITDFIVHPQKEKVLEMLEAHPGEVAGVFGDYLEKMFPSEEDRKKS